MNCAYLSISEPGKRSFTLIVKRSGRTHYTVKQNYHVTDYHIVRTTVCKAFSGDTDVKCNHRKNELSYFLNHITCSY